MLNLTYKKNNTNLRYTNIYVQQMTQFQYTKKSDSIIRKKNKQLNFHFKSEQRLQQAFHKIQYTLKSLHGM